MLPGFVLDIDATIVLSHSEKEAAAATWNGSFGYHPLITGQARLVDDFHLWVYPLVVGADEPGMVDGWDLTAFMPAAAVPFDSGAVVVVYRPTV
jgi:hypothetical protein